VQDGQQAYKWIEAALKTDFSRGMERGINYLLHIDLHIDGLVDGGAQFWGTWVTSICML
jgi:hypothetical protein